MTKKNIFCLFLLFELSALLFGNSFLGLFESSEARYAEVAREMLETKDFISPQMNYVYHFTKPPFAYWMASLGMSIFGQNPFGVRFFVAFFAIMTMFIVYKIAEEMGGDGFLSALILGSFPLFFIMGKILTTDMFLTFFVALGFYLFILYKNKKLSRMKFSLWFAVIFALAVLTKGQVAILYWTVIFIPFCYFNKDFKQLKVFLSPVFLFTGLLLCAWWFVVVGIKHPGLLEYLFLKEGVEAAYSSERFHPGPFYYYIPVLFGGLFPFIFLFPSLEQIKEKDSKILYGYTFLPFILFTIFPAKLPTYLLPSLPGWALLFSSKEPPKRRINFAVVSFLLFQVLFLFFLLFKGEKMLGAAISDIAVVLLFSSIFSVISLLTLKKKDEKTSIAVLFLSILLTSISMPLIVSKNQEKFKIASEVSAAIKERIKDGDEVLELRTTIFSIPFYLQKKVYAFENNFFRKKFLSKKPAHILAGEDELRHFIEKNPHLFIIVDKNSEQFLKENYAQFKLIRQGSRYILYSYQEK